MKTIRNVLVVAATALVVSAGPRFSSASPSATFCTMRFLLQRVEFRAHTCKVCLDTAAHVFLFLH